MHRPGLERGRSAAQLDLDGVESGIGILPMNFLDHRLEADATNARDDGRISFERQPLNVTR
jgi:hypothetical protein